MGRPTKATDSKKSRALSQAEYEEKAEEKAWHTKIQRYEGPTKIKSGVACPVLGAIHRRGEK